MANEMKIDFATSWFRGPTLYVAAVFLVTATAFCVRMVASIDQLQQGQVAVVKSIDGLRTDMREIGMEHLSRQQFQVWTELLRAVNGANLKVPELPK